MKRGASLTGLLRATRTSIASKWIAAWVRAEAPVIPVGEQAFRHALDSLAVMERQVYILHRVEGRGFDEIASQLGLTRKESEAHLVAALRNLHRILYDLRD